MRLFAIILFFVTGVHLSADDMDPEDVVMAALTAAHEDKLRSFLTWVDLHSITSKSEGLNTPLKVIDFMRSIDLSGVSFETLASKDDDGDAGSTATIFVQMKAPFVATFILTSEEKGFGSISKITGIVSSEVRTGIRLDSSATIPLPTTALVSG